MRSARHSASPSAARKSPQHFASQKALGSSRVRSALQINAAQSGRILHDFGEMNPTTIPPFAPVTLAKWMAQTTAHRQSRPPGQSGAVRGGPLRRDPRPADRRRHARARHARAADPDRDQTAHPPARLAMVPLTRTRLREQPRQLAALALACILLLAVGAGAGSAASSSSAAPPRTLTRTVVQRQMVTVTVARPAPVPARPARRQHRKPRSHSRRGARARKHKPGGKP